MTTLEPQWVYGRVDPLETAPRYTTLAEVKARLGIGDTTRDAEITQAIVAAEYSIDAHLGRSFPDPGVQVLATAPWNTTRPSPFLLPPAAGELNIDQAGTITQMSKTDADSVDQSGATLGEVDLIIYDVPIVAEESIYRIESVTDNTTWWEITQSFVSGIPLPATMTNLRIDLSVFQPQDGGVGKVRGIPDAVKVAALNASIAVWKEADAPTGTAGSDAFIGVIDVSDITRRLISRSVVLRGFMVGDGFGIA